MNFENEAPSRVLNTFSGNFKSLLHFGGFRANWKVLSEVVLVHIAEARREKRKNNWNILEFAKLLLSDHQYSVRYFKKVRRAFSYSICAKCLFSSELFRIFLLLDVRRSNSLVHEKAKDPRKIESIFECFMSF